jgi:hypothetical protein
VFGIQAEMCLTCSIPLLPASAYIFPDHLLSASSSGSLLEYAKFCLTAGTFHVLFLFSVTLLTSNSPFTWLIPMHRSVFYLSAISLVWSSISDNYH